MTLSLLISLRETLEASMLIGVIVAFLHRDGDSRSVSWAWSGVAAGVLMSILLALFLERLSSVLTEAYEALYEGTLMLLAAGIVAWVVAWLGRNGTHGRNTVESTVRKHFSRGAMTGIFFLCFFATAREGMEMVLFLQASLVSVHRDISSSFGVILGMTIALCIAMMIFRGMRGVPLKFFFRISSAFLLCIGFGLTLRGIGELEEAHVLTSLSHILWDSSSLLDASSLLGHIATTFLGYVEQPTLLQLLSGAGYIALVLLFVGIGNNLAARRSV